MVGDGSWVAEYQSNSGAQCKNATNDFGEERFYTKSDHWVTWKCYEGT